MFFNKKYLTTAGKNLLDQAVAGSTITWGTCATSSRSYVSDDTARALTDIAVDGKYTSFGNVEKVVSSDNGNLVITCRFTNQSNSDVEIESGEARAFGVWAKREEDETFTLVIVAFWHLDEGSPETIPEQTQSFDATVDLYVKTSDNVISTIESNPSWMTSVDTFNSFKDSINNDLSDLNDFKDRATADLTALNNFKDSVNDDLDDLNDLKDRVVTTHSASSTSTGEDQTIKGIKTFDDDAYFNGNITFNSDVLLDGNVVRCECDLYTTSDLFASNVELNNLHVYDTVALGSINNQPEVQITATGIEDAEDTGGSGELTINFKTNSGGDAGGSLVLNDLDNIRLTSVSSGNIYASNYSLTTDTLTCDGVFLNDDNTVAIKWEHSESRDVDLIFDFRPDTESNKLVLSASDTTGGAVFTYSEWDLGTSSCRWNTLYVNNIRADNLYANNINTFIDNRISEIFSTTTPVGATRLVYIDAYNSGTDNYYMENAYADAGDQAIDGILNLEIRYEIGTSLVSTGDYISGKPLHLSDGTSVTGTWEIVRPFTLLANTAANTRKYFIAKRIA